MKYLDVSKQFKYCPDNGQVTRISTGAKVGTVGVRGYLCCGMGGKTVYVHRIAWCLYNKCDLDRKTQIDHINHNRLDNRIENLRATDNTGNSKNKTMRKINKSGATGVSFHKAAGKWRAFIKVNYKQVHLGLYDDFDVAVAARKAAESKYGFHENHE